MKDIMIEKSNILSYPHGFSTRLGGVSTGCFTSLNLGLSRGDDNEHVKENWKRFLAACEIDKTKVVCGRQVHGNRVYISGEKDMHEVTSPEIFVEADGFVTKEAGVPLAVFTADCIPLLLEDDKEGVIGAIHCGWRSTVADIPANAIKAMKNLGADASNIKAATGPAIRRECFEVGYEVVEASEALLGREIPELYDVKENGKYMLDLQGVLHARLLQLGLQEQNIESVGGCTLCNPDKYFSHRFSGPARGNLASVIMKV